MKEMLLTTHSECQLMQANKAAPVREVVTVTVCTVQSRPTEWMSASDQASIYNLWRVPPSATPVLTRVSDVGSSDVTH